jgi:hypothetical protein
LLLLLLLLLLLYYYYYYYYCYYLLFVIVICYYVFNSLCYLIFQTAYEQIVQEILAAYPDPVLRQRLANAFTELTANITLTPQRQPVLKFRDNFDKFIVNVHGFLLVK